jgi:GNAT superfamily N-acetyltransferase
MLRQRRYTPFMQIRSGVEGDLEQLFVLYSQLGQPDNPLTRERLHETWQRLIAAHGFELFVAERDGHLLGTFLFAVLEALGARCRPVAIVEDVVVDEAERGTGIGRAMMHFAMERATAAGCYKLMLSSNREREAAHRFYEELGFEKHGYSFQVMLGHQ